METPVYSIKNWNESKGYKDHNVLVEQDENLSKQIYTLNGKVREINNNLGTHSPVFSSDLRANDKYQYGLDVGGPMILLSRWCCSGLCASAI
jgi:hypothetical protein